MSTEPSPTPPHGVPQGFEGTLPSNPGPPPPVLRSAPPAAAPAAGPGIPSALSRAQGQPQQVPHCQALKTSHSPSGPSSLTCRCQPHAHAALGPDASSDQSSLSLRLHPSFPPGSPAPSAATYPGPGAAAGSRRRCPGRSGPSNPRCRAGSP